MLLSNYTDTPVYKVTLIFSSQSTKNFKHGRDKLSIT